jgi:hypothetical protein
VLGIDVTKEAVIQGRVLRGDDPVAGAYVRLLDSGGEFTAEVPTSATGHFRFFANDGNWTLRTLAPGASLDRQVVAARGSVSEVDVNLELAAV